MPSILFQVLIEETTPLCPLLGTNSRQSGFHINEHYSRSLHPLPSNRAQKAHNHELGTRPKTALSEKIPLNKNGEKKRKKTPESSLPSRNSGDPIRQVTFSSRTGIFKKKNGCHDFCPNPRRNLFFSDQKKQAAGEIARHTTQATRRPISHFTVARRLHGGGLFARRPVRCVPLTSAHRRRRSLWCREHWNWRDNEWGRVLFTDESRFSLSSDSHRILIWREREAAIIPRTSLKGTVNGTRYCNEILLPYVRLFRGAMGLQFLFMDDNAPCHRTVASEQLLESRRLAARTLPPVTIRELRLALQDEWAAMPQQVIDTLILSMGRRCETCLAVREIISPY
ncbi:transposable element Tcb1 transposase [Trichonephila clavipes]|uniref:Transposable element Tcb1 transposase n=1 Tax=Trichonephila clavipes TaxID=2585209 RepID=A0A8X6SIX5_TRICX|nr:transposable element Tcb1 transposase [Trichonephila clavipes]